MAKEAVARREINKERDQKRTQEQAKEAEGAMRRAFAEFYVVSQPASTGPGGKTIERLDKGYKALLDILDETRDDVARLASAQDVDNFVADIAQKSLRQIPEIQEVWSEVMWPVSLTR